MHGAAKIFTRLDEEYFNNMLTHKTNSINQQRD